MKRSRRPEAHPKKNNQKDKDSAHDEPAEAGGLVARLGPGLITGAADDDPGGIATYSQAGAEFRYSLVWTLFLTWPLMVGIQMLSARVGWATGAGLAKNIDKMCPRWLTVSLVGLLVVANTINIAADLAAMGEAVKLLAGGWQPLYVLGFGALCIVTQIRFSYEQTVRVLKWLTLALFAYVAVTLTVGVPWKTAALQSVTPWSFLPEGTTLKSYAAMVVAVLGTTISPYLFFWQAAQEVEESRLRPGRRELLKDPEYVAEHLSRIKQDTIVGMTFSNLVALCIVLATAVTLGGKGVAQIESAAQAAEALRPIAGEFAFAVFAMGIVGTGLLAVPVLAGSAAYAVSELFGWKAGLSQGFRKARGFYLIIIFATGIGTAMGILEVDPMHALVWSAMVNGVIAVPIMVVLMLVGQSSKLMGPHTISLRHRVLGWAATAVMAAAVAFMLATSLS